MSTNSIQLWVVATPIGNYSDLSARAIEVLKQVDAIAAEDTRRTGQLLNHYAIQTPMLAYHDHNEQSMAQAVVDRMQNGECIALVSDAGTPMVSDPGFRLVELARKTGLNVSTVPGPSAAIAALSISGLPCEKFSFLGFPPHKGQVREKWFAQLKESLTTVVIYESSHRILDAMKQLQRIFGDEHLMFMGRELTKTFETTRRASVSELLEWMQGDANQQKGEFVLVIPPVNRDKTQLDEETRQLLKISAEYLPPAKAAKLVSAHTGLDKRQLYDYLESEKA